MISRSLPPSSWTSRVAARGPVSACCSTLPTILPTATTPLPVLDAVKHRVAVVHLNDIRRAGHFEPVLLGTGVAPVVDLLAMLVDAGFDGWVSVEEASAQGPGVFADAMHTADHAWVQAGGSPRKPAVAHPTSQEE